MGDRQALFLGAGAGFDCGMPLLTELSAELRRWLTPERLEAYNSVWQEEDRGWPDELIGRLTTLLRNPELNHEDIASKLHQDYPQLDKPALRGGYVTAYHFLMQTVYGLLLERQLNNAHYTKVAMADYGGLKVLAEANKPLWIFTTNQDCLIELLAARLFIPLQTGLEDTVERIVADRSGSHRSLEFNVSSIAALSGGSCRYFSAGEYGINLVKLQGSLDMFSGNGNLYKLSSNSRTFDNYLQSLAHLNDVTRNLALEAGGITSNETLFCDESGQLQRWHKYILAVPPETKTLGQGGMDFYPLLDTALQQVNELVVVGSSFNNPAVNRRLRQWLSDNTRAKIQVVNPENGKCPQSLVEHADQVQVSPRGLGASDYFLGIQGGKQSLVQRLQRNARSKARLRLYRKTVSG